MTPSHQAAVILDAAGVAGPEFDHGSRMRVVASITEELTRGLWKAVMDGKLTVAHVAQFNAGTWPSESQLRAKVKAICAKADAMRQGVT